MATNTRKLASLLGASGAGIANDGTLTSAAIGEVIVAGDIAAGAVDTAELADNAVSLAKLAGGTDGQVITYDASGDPVAVGPGTDGQVLTSTGAGSPPAFEALPAGGLSEADTWRLNTTFNVSTNETSYPNYWERDDTDANGLLGTGMTQSGGIFTFPSTGFWLVQFHLRGYLTSSTPIDRYISAAIQVTTNNSSYSTAATSATHVFHTSTSAYTNFHANPFKIIDVTDTTNIKVKFYSFADNTATQVVGNTNGNETSAYFIKLGAT